MGDARKYHRISGEFAMQRGHLKKPVIAYETWGQLNTARDNGVLILTGLSPSAHVASSSEDSSAGWWEDIVGSGKAIDTSRYFVICVNSLGSCFGSTGASSINPDTGQPYRLAFPVLTLEDVASAAHEVVRQLGIERLHSVVGASMGGMSALAYSLMFPNGSLTLLSISAAVSSRSFSIALRSLQRELIRSDPNWNEGTYTQDQYPIQGMRLARKLGMISYRSAKEWHARFGRERVTDNPHEDHRQLFGIDFEVESYLQANALKFSDTFDANCYLYLSRAMDLFDAADHGGSIQASMRLLTIKLATIVGVQSDFLFPIDQQVELADHIRHAGIDVELHQLDSIQGHDSFLVDMDRFRPVIADHFNRG